MLYLLSYHAGSFSIVLLVGDGMLGPTDTNSGKKDTNGENLLGVSFYLPCVHVVQFNVTA